MRVLIAGSGTWRTALAHVFRRAGLDVTIQCRRSERAEELRSGVHSFLPDLPQEEGYQVCLAGEDTPPLVDLVISAIST